MEEKFTIKNLTITLRQEDENVRITTPRKILLAGQNTENVTYLIKGNFKKVEAFYQLRVMDHPEIDMDQDDLHEVYLLIVLDYLYMYNGWRVQYLRKKYDNLDFKEKDFGNPTTYDIVFRLYREKYPEDWEMKCSVLLGMSLEELRKCYERRLQYYNK